MKKIIFLLLVMLVFSLTISTPDNRAQLFNQSYFMVSLHDAGELPQPGLPAVPPPYQPQPPQIHQPQLPQPNQPPLLPQPSQPEPRNSEKNNNDLS